LGGIGLDGIDTFEAEEEWIPRIDGLEVVALQIVALPFRIKTPFDRTLL